MSDRREPTELCADALRAVLLVRESYGSTEGGVGTTREIIKALAAQASRGATYELCRHVAEAMRRHYLPGDPPVTG